MELKEFKDRPFLMMGLKKYEGDYNEGTREEVKNEILKHGLLRKGIVKGTTATCIVVEGENMDFETCAWVGVGEINDVMKRGIEMGESFRADGYEDVYIYYITHLHIQGLTWGEDVLENYAYNPDGNTAVYTLEHLDDPDECIDNPLDLCWTSLEALYGLEDHSVLDYGAPIDVYIYDRHDDSLFTLSDSEYENSMFDEYFDTLEYLKTLRIK